MIGLMGWGEGEAKGIEDEYEHLGMVKGDI